MRVKGGVQTAKKHKKILKLAEGFRGRRGNCYKHAKLGVHKALQYSYRDRRAKKREFRALWITRLNAGVRGHGMSYSRFIVALKQSGIELNRKVLSEIAFNFPESFGKVVKTVSKN